MASKPAVTLTLAGDEKRLTESFDRVGAASKQMADKVGDSSKDMDRAGRGFDGLTEKSDIVDTRAMGFRDTITGLQDGFKGLTDDSLSLGDRLVTLGMGVGDMASGVTNLLGPALASLATFMRTQLATAMTFIAAHPLLIVLGLLAVAFVVLWTQSETFRNIVIGVFNTVSGFIRSVFGGTIGWIIDRWNNVVGFFSGLPDRIGRAFGSLGRILGDVFRGAANIAIEGINWLIRRANDAIYGINVINPFDNIPYLPLIARLHSGGVFHAPGGRDEGLALLKDGERVSAVGQGGGGAPTVTFGGDTDGAFATAFMNLVRTGQIQINPGGA